MMRNWNQFLLIIVVLLVTCNPTVALTVWPDTGQNKCYDNYGPITCPQKGQPFHGQDAQYQGQQPSYTKLDANGNALPESAGTWAMVRDNVTALTWEVKTDDGTVHDGNNTYYWCNSSLENPGSCDKESNTESFINSLNSANFGGHHDWRLPSVYELATLIDSATREPAANTNFFPNTSTSGCNGHITCFLGYWSSTIMAGSSYEAWKVKFEDGGGVYPSEKKYNSRARAVRGGNDGSLNKYVDNQDGTVTDSDTGLMWQQDPSVEVDGVSGVSHLDWEEALAYVASLNLIAFAGHSDWHLANRNELQTLVDYSRTSPAINTDFFPKANRCYWSSSTEYGVNEMAWTINFSSGVSDTYRDRKTYSNSALAVRTYTAFRLSVGKTGNGTGSVTSSPAGISCGNDCSETYDSGTIVSLTATAGNDSIFTGWSGACSGTGNCVLTMNNSRSVGANFKNPSLVEMSLTPVYLLLLNSHE